MAEINHPRQQDLPNKPSWDTSLSSLHPALRDLTVSEQELKAVIDAAPSGLATPEEKVRAHALACVESYAANLKLFSSPYYDKPDKVEKVRFYRIALAGALGDAGRFEEAEAVLQTGGTGAKSRRKTLPGCHEPLAIVKRAREAVEKPDDERCQCERPTIEVDVDPDKPERGTRTLTLNRRQELGKVFRESDGKVLTHFRCGVCGFENAYEKIPTRQVKVFDARADIDQHIRSLWRPGRTLTARDWRPDPLMSDANLLKADD